MKALSCFIFVGSLAIIMGGCTKEQEPRNKSMQGTEVEPQQSKLQGAGIVPPSISMAEIVAGSLVSEKPLVVQYVSDNTESQPLMCRFRWYVDGCAVTEVSGNVLEPRYFRKGSRVEVEVIPLLAGIEGTPRRTAPVIVKNTLPVVNAIEFSPLLVYPGTAIAVKPAGTDWDNDDVTFFYQWEVNGTKVPGATLSAFDTSGLKRGDIISITVTPYDGEERGAPVRSPKSVTVADRIPEITSIPPSGLENGVYTYQVRAKDPDGDPLTYGLVKAPEGMTIDRSTGLVRWEPPRQIEGKREVTVKVSVDDGNGGMVYQEFSLFLEMK